jgi:hypothetical protein
MQDNKRPQNVLVVRHYLQDEELTLMNWSVRNPDLNLMEHLWEKWED